MPFDSDEVHSKIEAMEAIRRERSPLLASAIETLDAAVWVLAGGSHAQAVSLFHTAIELSLKAELDRVHRALISLAKAAGGLPCTEERHRARWSPRGDVDG
jgi:hypothetical protein